jgi:hypothetical protein
LNNRLRIEVKLHFTSSTNAIGVTADSLPSRQHRELSRPHRKPLEWPAVDARLDARRTAAGRQSHGVFRELYVKIAVAPHVLRL